MKVNILSVLLSFLFLVSATSRDDGISLRIIGGNPAPVGIAPYHVSIQNLQGVHVCGGAIISTTAILSAAHCFKSGVDPAVVRVVAGTNDLESDHNVTFNVSKIVMHEEYSNETKENDIAILITSRKIRFSRLICPISFSTQFITEGLDVILTGFGSLTNPGNATNTLQMLNLQVFNFTECQFAYRRVRRLFESQLCTFTSKGQGSCHGDSGAPLVWGNALVGIASFGIPCGVGYPDVYTRTQSFSDWIKLNAPGL